MQILMKITQSLKQRLNTHEYSFNEEKVKSSRRKHKIDLWMTYGILNSENLKIVLYKKLIKINRDSLLFVTKKQEFNAFKNTLRRL